MIKRKKILFLIIVIISLSTVFMLTGCSSAPTDDSQLRATGHVAATLDCNGGMIGRYSTRLIYAMPGSKILEPGANEASLAAAVLDDIHELEGWYTGEKDEEGNIIFDKKWDFQKDTVSQDTTLYARWIEKLKFVVKGINSDDDSRMEKAIRYVSNFGSDSAKTLQKPAVSPDWEGNTFIDYFADEALTQPFKFPVKHNGDEENNEFVIYARFVKGEYRVVRTAMDMNNIGRFTNLFVLQDIDMRDLNEGGQDTNNWSMPVMYSGTIRGDTSGGGIKEIRYLNFKISKLGEYYSTTRFGLFGTLDGAEFDSIAFTNCTVNITIAASNTPVFGGMLAGEIKAASFKDFSISGDLTISNQIKNNPELFEYSKLYGTIENNVSLGGCEYNGISLNLVTNS